MSALQLPQAWIAAVMDAAGGRVGLGVLVQPGHMVTCAHVVARALGLPEDQPTSPDAPVTIEALGSRQTSRATVRVWHPVDPEFRNPLQDICALEIANPALTRASWADLTAQEPRQGNTVRVFGYVSPHPPGRLSRGHVLAGEVDGGWWQLDPPPSPLAGHTPIGPGFSGSLAWDMSEDKAVGIVVAKWGTTSFVIPSALLRTACELPGARAAPLVSRAAPVTRLTAGDKVTLACTDNEKGAHKRVVGIARGRGFRHHDVFLCHNSRDKRLVRELGERLRGRGLSVWLDEWEIPPGQPWQEALERAIRSVRSAAVLYGPSRIGPWEDREVRAFLDESVKRRIPVIPVLLPGTTGEPELPVFLRAFTWVDMRGGLSPEALDRLAWGITGKRPDSMAGVDVGAHENHRPPPSAAPQAPLFKLWNVPPLPTEYRPRREIEDLKVALISPETRPLALTGVTRFTLQGMGGVGKTVLAAALARDAGVRRAFPEGVFWLPLGQAPEDVLVLQSRLANALGASRVTLRSVEEGKTLLRELFADRACLLVLDDVWEPRHAEPFNVLGERGKLLVTTRKEAVGRGLGAESRTLAELPAADALELLARYAGRPKRQLPPEAPALVRECGELPLALAMAGSLLRGKPANRWPTLLERLRHADIARLKASLPDYPHDSLLAAIEVSVDDLPEQARERYLDLAIFPEDTPIPEAVLQTYWALNGLDEAAVQEIVDQLVDRALSHRDTQTRLVLHDLQHDYVRAEAGDLGPRHKRLVEAYRRVAPEGLHAGPDDGYFFQHVAAHVLGAEGRPALRTLLFDDRWLAAKLRATETNALLADFDGLDLDADEPARLLRDALRLSTHILDQDPDQIASQLAGRLLEDDVEELRALAQTARRQAPRPSLWPVWPRLTPPGGPLLRTLEGHQDEVLSVAFSPDGARALSGSRDKTLKLWDIGSGKVLRSFEGHQAFVRSVAFSPDGTRALSGSSDKTLRLWDVGSGEVLRSFEGHHGSVHSVVFSPDGMRALSGSTDNTLKLWDIGSGRILRSFEGFQDLFESLRRSNPLDHSVESVAFSPDGARALSGSSGKTLKLWDVESGKVLRYLAAASYCIGQTTVCSVAFSPDGTRALSGSGDNALKLWEVGSGEVLRSFEGHHGSVYSVAFSPDGTRALSGSGDNTLKVWDVGSRMFFRSFNGHRTWVTSVAFSPDATRALSGSSDKTLKLWDVGSGKVLRSFKGHQHAVLSVAVSPDGTRALSGSNDDTLKLWDVGSGKVLRSFEGHCGGVRSVAFSPTDGTRSLSGSEDGSLELWDVGSGRVLRSFEGHRGGVRSVAFSPDSTRALSGSDDRTLKLWDVGSGKVLRSFEGHQDAVSSVAFSPDGTRALSGSHDKTLKLWDVGSGKVLRSFEGHQDAVSSVAFSPDGARALSAAHDKALRLWAVGSGALLCMFTADASVACLALAPDGYHVVAGDGLGRVHLLEILW